MIGFGWIPCGDGGVPSGAIQGGYEANGTPLYIGRGEYSGGVHIGKVAPHLGGLLIAYGGREVKLRNYEVLTGSAMQLGWLACSGPKTSYRHVPVEAGREEDGRPLYVARIEYEGGLHIGKAAPHLHSGVSFPYASNELGAEKYWVLVHS